MGYFIENDGGKKKAGFKTLNDCGIRAVAIANDISYNESRKILKTAMKKGKQGNGQISHGIYKEDMNSALKNLGWKWQSSPHIEGRKAKYHDLPKGRVIARMAKHFVAVIDGHIHDTWDCSEKMVYGYWVKATL
jgi:hypothetical protein